MTLCWVLLCLVSWCHHSFWTKKRISQFFESLFTKPFSTKTTFDRTFLGISHRLKKHPTARNTKGRSIIVPLTSYLAGLDWSVLQIKTKNVSCHTADSKPVKQEVFLLTVILSIWNSQKLITKFCRKKIQFSISKSTSYNKMSYNKTFW